MTTYTSELSRLHQVCRGFFALGDYESIVQRKFKELGVILAGGTINSIFSGRAVKDLDLYTYSDKSSKPLIDFLVKECGYAQTWSTNNACTLNHKETKKEIQVIYKFSGDPEFILSTFDFTIVQGAYCYAQAKFVLADRFLTDIASRRLIFTNTSRYPICALYRTKKYQARGYSLGGTTMVAIALAIHRLTIHTYADLKDQLMGIDTSIFRLLTEPFEDAKKFEASEFLQYWHETFETNNDEETL